MPANTKSNPRSTANHPAPKRPVTPTRGQAAGKAGSLPGNKPGNRANSKTSARPAPTRRTAAKSATRSAAPPPQTFPPFRVRLERRLEQVRQLFRRRPTQPLPARHTPTPTAARRSAQPVPQAASQTEPRPLPPLLGGMSLDRRLDVIGYVLAGVGFITLLLLLSSNHDAPTAGWLNIWWAAFGWGAYLFPFTLLVIGGWLIIRNFQRVPWPSVERIVGLIALFFNFVALLEVVDNGGMVGKAIFGLLTAALGVGGAAVALAAWLLLGVTLALDITVLDLFRWVPPLILRLQDAWDDFRTRNGAAAPQMLPRPVDVAPQTEGAATPQGAAASSGPAAASPAPGQPRVWVLPTIDEILEKGDEVSHDDEIDRQRAHVIEQTLASFGAPVNVVEINRGPTITQFGVEPDFIETRTGRVRVRVGKISALADDLALALAARTIRVQAPVPGKGYVGVEVPNEQIARVMLRDVIESEAFGRLKSPLRFALGQDVAGNAVAAALDAMPHLLIAGSTGSGKSVCVNALISCLLLNNTPDDLRLIMVDPKRVELTGYNGIPHLLAPVVVEMERVVGALQWVLREMDTRYHKLAQIGTRNISEYNAKVSGGGKGEKKLPRLVVIIDELADLMMLAPDETERTITRLAQLARATGIHLVLATQRPSVDVVTGIIKANFPARVAFAVASGTDSRVILDQTGAERLLGRGDMLFQAPDAPAPLRIQGAFLSDTEIYQLVQFWRAQNGFVESTPSAAGGVVDAVPAGVPLKQMPLWEEAQEEGDPLLNEAIDLARRQGRASITMLQRRLRIGYTRGARLIETMQEKGIIGKESGPQGFEILDYGPTAPPADDGV